jgi:hypothetical protein
MPQATLTAGDHEPGTVVGGAGGVVALVVGAAGAAVVGVVRGSGSTVAR